MAQSQGKPKFDPSQPYQPALDSKPKFDPNQPYDEPPSSTDTSLGEKLQAAATGIGNAATLGYLPQINATIAQMIPEPGQDVENDLLKKGAVITKPYGYVSDRDRFIKQQEALKERNPISYGLGSVEGTLASGGLLGAGVAGVLPEVAQGAGLLSRTIQGAAGGAASGALENPGDVKGQLNPLQLEKRQSNMESGAITGGALPIAGKVVSGIGGAIAGAGNKALTFAGNRAAAALGMNKGQFKKLLKRDPTGMAGKTAQDLGNFALQNKIIQPGDDIESILGKTEDLRSQVGKQIGDIYDQAENALSDPKTFQSLNPKQQKAVMNTNFNPVAMAKEFLSDFTTRMKGQPGGKQAIGAVKNEVENLLENSAEMGPEGIPFYNPETKLGIKQIQDFKSGLDDLIFAHDRIPGALPENKKALSEFRDFLKTKIENRVNTIDTLFGNDLGTNLKDLNSQYGKLSTIKTIARDRLASEQGNNFLSLTDKMSGIGGAMAGAQAGMAHAGIPGSIGGAIGGGSAALVSKAGRTYGRPLVAIGAQKAAPMLQKVAPIGGLIQGGANALTPAQLGAIGGLLNRKGP